MRLANRRPGSSTVFTDASNGETILEVTLDSWGAVFVGFRLYDASGVLVAHSAGLKQLRESLTIRSGNGDLLLDVPVNRAEPVRYQLHNHNGDLLTSSNGDRTHIGPLLRMGGVAGHFNMPRGHAHPRHGGP